MEEDGSLQPIVLPAEPPIPVVVHLSGKLRGTTERLSGDQLTIGTSPQAQIHFSTEPGVAQSHAVLARQDMTYVLHADSGEEVWVNGVRAGVLELDSGDVLEIGQGGPLLRFRLYQPGTAAYKSMAEAFSDCLDCAKNSAGDPLTRTGVFLKGIPRELAVQTSPWTRLGIGLLLLALAVSVGYLLRRSERLEQRLEQQSQQVQGIADLLELTGRNALKPEDLDQVRADLEQSVTEAAGRLETLEARAGASKRVIGTAGRSVIFLQGAYGFNERASGKPLRLGLGPDGRPVVDALGNPMVTTEGQGPPLEASYTGTGFVATADGLLLTNRHVALPWKYEQAAEMMAGQGFEPVMRRFVGYLPGVDEPVDVELVKASDEGDVAVLRCSQVTHRVPTLELREEVPQIGDEVIVLGFPTGIQALLARADESFVAELAQAGDLDFWTVAQRLAKAGHIGSLASRGIVGQVTDAAVVYDAETTSGGSGGPGLNLDGKVVAINTAVIPQFGGSNLGVPAARARELLAAAAAVSAASEPLPAADATPVAPDQGDSEVEVALP